MAGVWIVALVVAVVVAYGEQKRKWQCAAGLLGCVVVVVEPVW